MLEALRKSQILTRRLPDHSLTRGDDSDGVIFHGLAEDHSQLDSLPGCMPGMFGFLNLSYVLRSCVSVGAWDC